MMTNTPEPIAAIPTRDVCLVGTLETWPLADIIVWANQTHRTGMVRVGMGLMAGILFFKDGNLFRCEWGKLTGEHALLALLSMRSGSFSLIQRDPPEAKPNIFRPTAELLLQIAVAHDERRRAGAA